MSRIYKVGIVHEKVTTNPVANVQIQCTSQCEVIIVTPEQKKRGQ